MTDFMAVTRRHPLPGDLQPGDRVLWNVKKESAGMFTIDYIDGDYIHSKAGSIHRRYVTQYSRAAAKGERDGKAS